MSQKMQMLFAAFICVSAAAGAGGWAWSLHVRGARFREDNERIRLGNAALADQLDALSTGKPYLATCAVCKGAVSSDAASCPHCGHAR